VEVDPIVEALRKLKGLVESLRKEGMDIRYLDLGEVSGSLIKTRSLPIL